jgi:hypothetical protein
MHINFPIEDYRKEVKWKISGSVTLKAPVCTLFNISLDPPVGIPLSVRAPLEPVKGRARTLGNRSERSIRAQAFRSPKL